MTVCLIGEGKGCAPTDAAPTKIFQAAAGATSHITKAMLTNNSGLDCKIEIWITNDGEAVDDSPDGVPAGPGGVPPAAPGGSCNKFGCVSILDKEKGPVTIECLNGEYLEPGQCIWMRSDCEGVALRCNYRKLPLR